jgi:hypothetical protein
MKMGGRPSKPTDLIICEGKSHRTKAELNVRKSAEKALYTGVTFKEQQQVKDNQIAHIEFLRLKKLYGKISYVDALDQNIINRYCLEVAAIYDYQSHIDRMNKDLELTEKVAERLSIYEMIGKTYDRMNKSKALLLKYEDRLLLTPSGRMRAIPKTPPQEEDASGFDAFFKGRADAQ